VNCDRYREAASARLDGEPLGLSSTALDEHLASCAACARWLAAVTTIGRSARVGVAPPPELAGRILEGVVVDGVRSRARRRWLRASLAMVGLLQWALAIPGLSGGSVGMAMAMHPSHESAAWNIALGASFIAVAVRPDRVAGAIPILGTFLVALTILSLPDLAGGEVPLSRLASHGGVVLGLLLMVLMSRSNRLFPDARGAGASDDSSDAAEPSVLRVVPNQQGVA
jgi:predicted anti-sigma-YlaC factor YlaD